MFYIHNNRNSSKTSECMRMNVCVCQMKAFLWIAHITPTTNFAFTTALNWNV